MGIYVSYSKNVQTLT